MPFESMTLNNVCVSTDGGQTYTTLGKISDVDITPIHESTDNDKETYFDFNTGKCFEVEMNMHWYDKVILMSKLGTIRTRKDLIQALMLIAPNNWLKQHGLPMRRR